MIASPSPASRPDERRRHRLDLAAQRPAANLCGSSFFAVVEDRLHFPRDASQIAPLHRAENVDDRLHVVVRNDGGVHLSRFTDASASSICGRAAGRPVTGIVPSSSQRVDAVLRRLRRDRVADAGGRVEPERRRRLAAARQRDQQVVRDVALREAGLRGARPVDVEVEQRLVERLVHPQVDHAGHLRQLRRERRGEPAVRRRGSRPTTWTSIGAGSPKFRICVTMSAGMNEKGTPGKRSGSRSRRSCTYSSVGRWFWRQRDQDVGVAGADRRRVACTTG